MATQETIRRLHDLDKGINKIRRGRQDLLLALHVLQREKEQLRKEGIRPYHFRGKK